MMFGSMMFTSITTGDHKRWSSKQELLQTVLAISGLSLVLTTGIRNEFTTFGCYCLFEGCVGMYFPCMAYLKGKVVDNENRAHVYSLLRIPFNVFVVVAFSLTHEGDQYREAVFIFCSGLLLIASAIVGTFLRN